MNFQTLPPIERQKLLLDGAFHSARDAAGRLTVHGSKVDTMRLARERELARVKAVKTLLAKRLDGGMKAYPSISELSRFYQELIRCFLDVGELKRALAAMHWAAERINDLAKEYEHKIRSGRMVGEMRTHRTAFYGRVSSTVKRIDPQLGYLEESRRVLRSFPDVQEMFTAAIAGFPNVGKSTLLARLSGARPKIADYSFTTRTLNLGYISEGYPRVQVIDTPGTLNRFEQMNDVEKQAHLALRHLASCVIYVFDLTEPYPMKDQERLLADTRKLGKTLFVYVSKADMLDPAQVREFCESHGAMSDSAELRKMLLDLERQVRPRKEKPKSAPEASEAAA